MSILTISESTHLYYKRIEGLPDKPHLVFLHEGLGCSAMWKEFPEQLCNETRCPGLIYDRLGYGSSSPTVFNRTIDYLHESALHELPMVLRSLIPGKQYILIGHSDGGSISLIWAAKNPPLVVGVITEAAHVFVDAETLDGIRRAEKAFAQGKLNGLYSYHGEKTDHLFKAWTDTWLSPWFKNWNIENVLQSIQCPILSIQGCDDQYGTREQVSSICSHSSGYAEEYFVKDCGHAPHAEKSAEIRSIMTDFISRITTEDKQCD